MRLSAALALGIASSAAVSGFLVGFPAPEVQGADAASADEEDAADVLGANAACYVCHMTFIQEELARTHLAHEVGCVKCHGLSAAHANDEHIGATKPDIVYPRDRVDASCLECHKEHDVPAREVLARFIERKLPAAASPICTQCHGTHHIGRAAQPPADKP